MSLNTHLTHHSHTKIHTIFTTSIHHGAVEFTMVHLVHFDSTVTISLLVIHVAEIVHVYPLTPQPH